MIQDKRFKHLAHSFIDPRSPSEGIVRTPIVIKSSEISSIVNTPRILEEELDEQLDDEEDFQKTFEERLSRLSFDCLEQEEGEEQVKLPSLIETHFDECLMMQPIPPMTLATNLVAQAAFDPRSPTIGIDRTPLVFGDRHSIPNLKPTTTTFADQLRQEMEKDVEEKEEGTKDDEEGENEKTTKDEDKETAKEITIEGVVLEEQQQPTIVEPADQTQQLQSDVFVDVGRIIYGTPVQMTASGGPIQQVRTPLSCLANRKRTELNGKGTTGKSSALSKKQQKPQDSNNCAELKVKKTATNPFEKNNTPRKAIR